ncbi:fimbrillin family protein [Mucilaginibacter sp. CSA2-8R]|uniref:fimbrillin family protein n=1 Tax=Mucilaginibacter sp. CSA2-8R TaxID=3141542 RepID=UPI00315D9430
MRIRNLQVTFVAALLLLVAACRKDRGNDVIDVAANEVRFSASINGQIKTKATNDKWDANDAIGVFMKTGTGLSNALASNKKYITVAGDGEFKASATDQSIFYPESGTVDFVAYYPYQQTLSGTSYSVNVANQTNQAAIDLMYATANSLTKNSTAAQLAFTHQLSKIEITVKNGNGVPSLTGLSTTLVGLKNNATFDLAYGTLSGQSQIANIQAKNSVNNGATLAEAIVIPTTDETGIKAVFTIGSKTYTLTLPATTKFEAGKKYAYEVELRGDAGDSGVAVALKASILNWTDVPSGSYSLDQGTVVVNPPTLSGYMETPLITTNSNSVYVFHEFPGRTGVRNYAMLYDKQLKMAYWVAYPLHSSYMGSSGRTDAWQFDPLLAQNVQPDLSTSYGNGYDRGHQIPSADRTATSALNQTTFYYSNMTAQVSSMNQGIWANLENQVRTWSAQGDTLYVVTGAAAQSSTDQTVTYSNKGSAIPKYYYKVLALKKGSDYYTIGFKIANAIIPTTTTYNNYRMTVSDLEKETGFTFFPKLSTQVKSTIDANVFK